MRNTFISVYFHHVSRLGERMEECFVSKYDSKENSKVVDGDIVFYVDYYDVEYNSKENSKSLSA